MNSIRQNMTYEIGTKVLIKISEMLSDNHKNMVYSIYANEVAAIIPTSDFNKAYEIGLNLLNKMTDSMAIDRYQIGILLNGSIVQYPLHIKDSNDAIKKSAMILDQTTNDFGLHEYNDEMERKSRLQGELVPELLHAIKKNEFHLVYQPKICLKGEENKSVEALLRWHHPFKGTISPLVFIPVAEEAGLMTEITKIVLRKVIEQLKYLKSVGLEIKASINISPRDFNYKGFTSFIKDTLIDCEIDPSLIELEVTERSVLDKSQRVIELFNEFRQMGIKISVDDFGTGYNSLIHLVNVPMDFVKLDRSFITNITKPKYQKMIQRLISLAHDLDIKVIAEGVETKEQLDILKDMNCDIVQGYYLSKPLEADALEAFYNNRV
jgi:EAL domain-containing protein (putative c-di-GMP-specific phosphodiesterase class I)